MLATPRSTTVQINSRGLAELVSLCLILTALTILGWWYWQDQNPFSIAAATGAPERLPLPVVLIQQMPMVVSLALVEFVVLLTLVFAVVPPVWWIRLGNAQAQTANAVPTSPMMWIGKQIENVRTQAAVAQSTPANGNNLQFNPHGSNPIAQSGQTQPGQPQPSQPLAGQAPGVPLNDPNHQNIQGAAGAQQVAIMGLPQKAQPGSQDPNATQEQGTGQPQQPGQTPEQQADAANAAPPQQSLQDALQFEVEEEEDVLAELGDMSSLISSAFNDSDEIDADLEALSKMVDPVDMGDLSRLSRQIAARFALGQAA